jgi:hypothetical protein
LIKLQKNSGGNWDNKKFKDYFQINCWEIINFNVLILLEISDSIAKNNSRPQVERYIIRRKIDEPAFFKNSLDSYPLSENSKFIAKSLSIGSRGIPMFSIN